MTTPSVPEYHDNSSEYQALIEKVKSDLAARLAGHETDHPWLTVFRELELESKKTPRNNELLMTAVLAGEKGVVTAPNKEQMLGVILSLANLLLQRSRWDPVARFPDIERALNLVSNALLQLNSVAWRISALKTLGSILEERYARTGDEQDLLQAHKRLQEAANLAEPSERKTLLADAACILFKIRPDALEFILDIPVEDLSKTPVSWSKVTHKKFRFIDARSLAAGERLRVVEFDALPRQRYVALSYVWRGSHSRDTQPASTRTMSIEGADGADPISIDVLITACKCVATLDCQLLWIDGVCIVQSDEEDKAWQIQNMFDIYKNCKQCLILPGGLSRLVPITEPTTWMHRAWTLQEAVAPEECTVLFSWTQGPAVLQTFTALIITSISPIAGSTDLYSLLTMSMGHAAHVVLAHNPSAPEPKLEINILTHASEHNQAAALLGALSYKAQQGLESAIWRASLTRVASRPADAIFSIMGILGVSLNPLLFSPNDRTRPTIALMQALLRKGERAEWLGVAPHIAINPQLSTLPVFPRISAHGKAVVPFSASPSSSAGGACAHSMSAWMGDTWWRLVGAPYGAMDDDGSLRLRSVCVLPVRREKKVLSPAVEGVEIRTIGRDEDVWYISHTSRDPPYALKIGYKERYTNAALAPLHDLQPWLVMLVEDDGVEEGRVRNLGYAAVGEEVVGLAGWREMDVVIQGTVDEVVEEHGGGRLELVGARRGGKVVV